VSSDDAASFIDRTGLDWHAISQYASDQLAEVLTRIHEWEASANPAAVRCPARSNTTTRPLCTPSVP
jgi:hypothetical protein